MNARNVIFVIFATLASIFFLGLTVFSVWTGYYPRAVIDLALTAVWAYLGGSRLRRMSQRPE